MVLTGSRQVPKAADDRAAQQRDYGLRPLALASHSLGSLQMRTAKEAAEHTALIAKQHITEQESRIERQVELIAALGRDGHATMVKDAQRLLSEMIVLLVEMRDDLREARERIDALSQFDSQRTSTR
jgi:hypothetical protein